MLFITFHIFNKGLDKAFRFCGCDPGQGFLDTVVNRFIQTKEILPKFVELMLHKIIDLCNFQKYFYNSFVITPLIYKVLQILMLDHNLLRSSRNNIMLGK